MGLLSKFFTGAAALATVAVAQEESKVVVLTQSNFETEMAANAKGILVEFYAPWCGHCKQLAPEYDAASLMLAESGSEYKLGKVDATVEKELGQKFEVQGYPTLKWMVGDQITDYDGARDRNGIVEWIKAVTGPAVTEGEPPADATGVAVVLRASANNEVYQGIAKSFRKSATWYFVESSDNKLEVLHKGEDPHVMSEGVDDKDKITAFFEKNSFPLFGGLDGESFAKYSKREGYGLVWGLWPMKADDVKEVVDSKREMMTEVAKSVGDKYSVTWTNTAEFGSVMESMFGVTEFPKIIVQKKGGDKKYFVYDGDEITADGLITYINKVTSGEIQPNLKSEAAPEEPQEDPVKIIVGSTLQEKVFTTDKDVMLEIYAPWCGHCKKLDPEYLKVGKKIIREGFQDKLVVAKMDGTANDSPVDSIEWSGFPTIYYIKAGSDKPMSFDGERTAKGIWKWMKKNSTYADDINAAISAKKDGGADADKENASPEDAKDKEEL